MKFGDSKNAHQKVYLRRRAQDGIPKISGGRFMLMARKTLELPQSKPKVKIVQNVGLCLHPSNYSHLWLLFGEIFVPSAINPRHQIWHTILTMRYRTTDLGEKRQNLVLPRSRIELQYCMQLLCPPSEHSGCWFSVKNVLQMQII